jgi:hypothetical protein
VLSADNTGTEVWSRSWPACLALGVAGRRTGRRLDVLSAASFRRAAGLRARGPLLVSPVRSRHLEAVFRSPKTTVRSRAAIMRSPFPTYFFNTSPNVLRSRSPGSSIADAGLPQSRRPQHRRTVPRCPPGNPSLASDLPPLRGFFVPSGSAVNPIWCREAHLPKQPDLLALPDHRGYR